MRNLLPGFQEADFRHAVKYYMDKTDEIATQVENLEIEVSNLKNMLLVVHQYLYRHQKQKEEPEFSFDKAIKDLEEEQRTELKQLFNRRKL